MRIRNAVVLLVLAGILAAPLPAQETRVTAGARKALQMLASIKVGAVVVTYVKDEDQSYTRTYRDVTRPEDTYSGGSLQGTDPVLVERIEAEIARLTPFADRNGDGAVAAPEGLEFRRVLEFGMMAAWVSRTEETTEVKRLAPLLRMSPDELRKNVRDYEALRERLGGYDSHLYPPLPAFE